MGYLQERWNVQRAVPHEYVLVVVDEAQPACHNHATPSDMTSNDAVQVFAGQTAGPCCMNQMWVIN
jgi:hypothetical protein